MTHLVVLDGVPIVEALQRAEATFAGACPTLVLSSTRDDLPDL